MKVYVVQQVVIPFLLSKIVKELELNSPSKSMNMAISGGSLPSFLGELRTDFNWSVFLADERVVEESSEDSNYKLIKEKCLIKWKNSTGYPINYEKLDDPEQIAKDYQSILDKVLGNSPFDLIFLGMGPDGKEV